MNRYLTTTEAADVLRCSTKTIRRMVQAGELLAMQHRGKWLIEANSLPSPDGPRRLPAPRASKYGGPGTMVAIAREVNARRAAR